MAGGSAAAKAQELRDKAARLEREAQQWDKGAEGERRTAAVLSSLAARGYVVLDDLAIPGSKANIDHVVIGPVGVVVVETKAYTGRVNVSDGVLWHGRYPLRKELAAAQFEADKVREVVASTGWTVAVRSLMCIHGVEVPTDPTGSLGSIELCGPLDLLHRIEAAPPLLGPAHVAHLVSVLERALPPQRLAIPGPPVPPPVSSGLGDVVAPLRRSRRTARPTRGAGVVRAVDSGLRGAARLLLRVVVVIIGALLMMAMAGAALQTLADQATTTTTTTTIPPPPPTTVAAAP